MGLQIFVIRRSGGKRMAHLRGMPVLLLNTVGRKSGKLRITPVMFMLDRSNYVVTASNNGAESNPGWFLNLMENPRITIEVEGATKKVTAHKASPEERERLWPQLVQKAPFFEDYRKATKREIPMVVLQPIDVEARE